ncbi:TraB/GumN family protein [Paenibacillus sp. GSMTC-2017]|uniref:TraB/GumN family protein n=1 Tax=Paenibacillus sp. GSMTC-2017 TaxID=2794350 RepID=UPI0018D5B846|nr:TraB/GumN family protein [Paenibacillus sp. GSMTC-2017]MBH5318995.1 TraB/GumN family protein [Paenibacillus sp. GSMTC-2017]
MKKMASLFIALIMLLTFATSSQAASTPYSILVDGEQLKFGKQLPIVEKGTLLVPVRSVSKNLHLEITWDEKSRVVTTYSKNAVITLEINHKTAFVNSQPKQLVVAPKIINKVTYVPLRFIVEAVGYELEWNFDKRIIAIDTIEDSKGFLWKVEKNGNVVYMLGSIHVASEAMYPLRKEIQEAYEKSDYLSVEVNVVAEKAGLSEYITKLGTYQDGTTLKDHISAETYETLVQFLTDLKVPTNTLDKFKPWLAASIISSWNDETSPFKSELGIDRHFINQAIKDKTPVLELESYESQLTMQDGFSAGIQEGMLLGTVQGFYSEDKSTEVLAKMWAEGSESELKSRVDVTALNEEYYNAMLKDRNILMVDKIDGYLKNEKPSTYFVVVGALHMVGDHGLVELLHQEGYKVTRQ